MIYTLTLNPALDYDIYLDNFLQGNLNTAKNTKVRAGGKGINVSKTLRSLGEISIAMGFVAGFSGEVIREELKQEGIETDFVDVEGTTRLNVKISANNEETEIAGIGPIILGEKIKLLTDKLSRLNSDDILVLSGSVPSIVGTNHAIYKNIVEDLSGNPKIVLDTRGDLIKQNLSQSKGKNYLLIKPNILELEHLFNKKIESNTEIIGKAKSLLDYGIQNVLVSKGRDGAILVTKQASYIATVPKGVLINSVGAGDSMVAGFISGILKGDIEEAFKLAVACGSATAYSSGVAGYSSIIKLYKDVKVTRI